MCKAGDIILVKEYSHDEVVLPQHSFVIIYDVAGNVKGLLYDVVCSVMSSFKSELHKTKKLSFRENFYIDPNDTIMSIKSANSKEGYIKADQFYFFNLSKIEYEIIGSMMPDCFNRLIEFIESLPKYEHVTSNL